MSEAEEYLSNKGYGKGINYSTKEVAYLMQSFSDQQNEDLKDDYERGYIKGYSDCSFKKDPKF